MKQQLPFDYNKTAIPVYYWNEGSVPPVRSQGEVSISSYDDIEFWMPTHSVTNLLPLIKLATF